MFRVLDLFSGIGGFSLGLERTGGFQTVAFCEIDPYCRRVLRKHWPDVPQYEDVRTLTAERLAADGIDADVICGGFPCQDISVAGKGAGIEGERSGLWSEYARIIGEIRPKFVIVENVAALLGRGLSRVLGDLAALGFDAEWHCIPASSVGAPHRRDRLWIAAYPQNSTTNYRGRRPERDGKNEWGSDNGFEGGRPFLAYTNGQRCEGDDGISSSQEGEIRNQSLGNAGANGTASREMADTNCRGFSMCGEQEAFPYRIFQSSHIGRRDAWFSESGFCRVAHGISARVDRIKSLGNSVVPQITEMIGLKILETEYAIHNRS